MWSIMYSLLVFNDVDSHSCVKASMCLICVGCMTPTNIYYRRGIIGLLQVEELSSYVMINFNLGCVGVDQLDGGALIDSFDTPISVLNRSIEFGEKRF